MEKEYQYLSYLGGPILFTAPHSRTVIRGGDGYNEEAKKHVNEKYAAYIAADLSKRTQVSNYPYNSFCVWKPHLPIDPSEPDPNYLLESNKHKSPFHQFLHKWVEKYHKGFEEHEPILHIDIHGKADRKSKCEVDVGLRPMEKLWKMDLYPQICDFIRKDFTQAFDGYKFGKFECVFNPQGFFRAFWGGNMQSMTEQSTRLNIPSFQLQFPRKVRQKLFSSLTLRKKFAEKIKQLYIVVITPWFKKNKQWQRIHYVPELAAMARETVDNRTEVRKAIKMLKDDDRQPKKSSKSKKVSAIPDEEPKVGEENEVSSSESEEDPSSNESEKEDDE